MTLFDDIRTASEAVAARASLVRIARERIRSYADSLARWEPITPALDPAHHYLGEGEGTLAFLITLDAVNFGSGYFPQLRKLPGLSGYFTIATNLTAHFRSRGPLGAAELTELTALDCARIFGQDGTNAVAMELMDLFARALRDLGRFLKSGFGGSFADLVESAGHSAEALVRSLARMPFYDDVQQHGSLTVPFFKRAQLTAADLNLAFGRSWGRFDDLDQLTIFADNLVPHVLRADEVLVYDRELAARIDAGTLIAAGSIEEVEIRAGALHAVELLKQELARRGSPRTAAELDHILWNRGQGPAYKQAHPRHRTRTVFY